VSIESLAPVLNGLTGAAFLVDRRRTLLFANSAGQALFGQNLTGLNFVQTVRHPNCLLAIDRVLFGQDRSEAVIELQQPVRTIYKVTVTALNRKTQAGDVPRALVCFDNISHIREAEQMRSEFVANVSHELRSPLTALSGFIETLQTVAKDDPEAQERFLEIMSREAQRMDRLIGDLLSLSRVEANKYIRPKTVVDVVSIAEQAIAVLSKRAEEGGHAIDLKADDGLVGLVQGDADQLLQVFLNLIENAMKYGDSDKGIEVRISSLERVGGMDGPGVSVQVTDYGSGIAPEHLSRLTERFYRVDGGRSREKGGTGLGLAIVKHILTRHLGRMRITSTVGEGSRFTVFLPAAPDAS